MTASVGAGAGVRVESQPVAASEPQWAWSASVEPTTDCTEVLIAVNRKQLFGGSEVIGSAAVPLSVLMDQQPHTLHLALRPPDPAQAEGMAQTGAVVATLRFADYEALRQSLATLVGSSSTESSTRGAMATTVSAPQTVAGGGTRHNPPPVIAVPANANAVPHAAGASTDGVPRVAHAAARPSSLASSASSAELGFLYEDVRLIQQETSHEQAALTRARTDAAGARLARNILRATVHNLVEKRRVVASELRRMESTRSELAVQLSLLQRKAAVAAEAEVEEGGRHASSASTALALYDEAERRHAAVLASRRSEHLTVVRSLQQEFVGSLSQIRAGGASRADSGGAEGGREGEYGDEAGGGWEVAPTGATSRSAGADETTAEIAAEQLTREWRASAALGVEGARLKGGEWAPAALRSSGEGSHAARMDQLVQHEGGVRSPTAAAMQALEAGGRAHTPGGHLHRSLLLLEAQLHQHREAILRKDKALEAAEGAALKLRGVAAVADEARAAAEQRAERAEAAALAAEAEAAALRTDLEDLRQTSSAFGQGEEAWAAERQQLLTSVAAGSARHRREVETVRAEHERAMRALEEDLAFETASRDFDRQEAQQLGAALKGRQRRIGPARLAEGDEAESMGGGRGAYDRSPEPGRELSASASRERGSKGSLGLSTALGKSSVQSRLLPPSDRRGRSPASRPSSSDQRQAAAAPPSVASQRTPLPNKAGAAPRKPTPSKRRTT